MKRETIPAVKIISSIEDQELAVNWKFLFLKKNYGWFSNISKSNSKSKISLPYVLEDKVYMHCWTVPVLNTMIWRKMKE